MNVGLTRLQNFKFGNYLHGFRKESILHATKTLLQIFPETPSVIRERSKQFAHAFGIAGTEMLMTVALIFGTKPFPESMLT